MSERLPYDSLVLVTGANGYIASHICTQLLARGYRVRGTVRDANANKWLLQHFQDSHGPEKFQMVQVSDFTQEGCFDDAMKGCSAVCATAGDFSLKETPHEVVPAAIKSMHNTLLSAAKHSTVKRVVLTSSSHTVRNYMANEKVHITPASWSMVNVDKAYQTHPDPLRRFQVYSAVKVATEKEFWRFMREEKPSFTSNTVVPNSNLGAILEAKYQRAVTARWVEGMYKNDWDHYKPIPPQYFVDVQDNASLHVAALIDMSIQNERILALAEPYNWNTLLRLLRKLRPAHDWPEDLEDDTPPLFTVDNHRGAQLLHDMTGRGWKSLEQSLSETLDSLSL